MAAMPAKVRGVLDRLRERHPEEHLWTSNTLLLARTGFLLGSKARVVIAGFDWIDCLKFSDHGTWEIEKWCPELEQVS